MCFYDLQKAFDSIQYPVLLKRLYESGWGEWQGLEDLAKLVHITKEHGESEWGALLTVHIRTWSSSRLRSLPSALPADNGPSLEIPTG